MLLFHGSNLVVEQPKIIVSERGRDFGPAFYVTPIQAQAERWAKRKQAALRQGKAVVSVYEWDEKETGLSKIRFDEPDMKWLEMILQCRSKPDYRHGHDIVEGKIADDAVGETVLFVMEGIMRKEDAVERLKFQKINAQIAFCTEKALRTLRFVRSYEVKR